MIKLIYYAFVIKFFINIKIIIHLWRDTYIERKPGEIANDRNDRAIRAVAKWYNNHFSSQKINIKVILLSDDEDNKQKANADGIPVASSNRKLLYFSKSSKTIE